MVPSISIERTTASSGTVTQAMEERALFLLLLLRQPRLRMIYVTSQPISEAIIEYYLGLLPGVIPSHARARLTLVPVGDASPAWLSSKLLARPRLLREIRALIPNAAQSHLIPYNTTSLERDVALSLAFRCTGLIPASSTWAVDGCRRMFEECGVQYPIGAEDLHTVDEIVAAVQNMRARRPSISQAIVKTNEGVSGSGNASFGSRRAARDRCSGRVGGDRRAAEEPGSRVGEADGRRLSGRLRKGRRHRRGADHRSRTGEPERPDAGTARRHRRTAVHPRPTSRWGERTRSTSVVCSRRIPATRRKSPSRRWWSGAHLAQRGVLGRFAVDFVVVQAESGEWTPYGSS